MHYIQMNESIIIQQILIMIGAIVKGCFASIQSIGVVGAGQMGTGIAIVANKTAHLPVTIYDCNPISLQKSKDFVDGWLAKQLKKSALTAQEVDQFRSRMHFAGDSSLLQKENVDFLIEAIVQNVSVKRDVLLGLSYKLKPEAIIASNTSSISITELAGSDIRPSQFIGMHFMNPVPIMRLVEVISGLRTSSATLATTLQLAKEMGKETSSAQDVPGFIANRLLMPYINEAIYVLYEGIGTKEDIDRTMKLGTNVPMGPLTLADFIGLDTCLSIMRVLHSQLGDSKYRPCPLLVNYVHAGYLGKKSGKGFYQYK